MDTLLQFGTVTGQRRIFTGDPVLSPTGDSQLHFRTQTVQSVAVLGGIGAYHQPGPGAVRRGSRTITGRWRVRGDGSLADIAAIKRSFDAMLSWGMQRLLKESGDGLQLWTWGTVEDVRVSENRSRLDYIWPTLTVTWRCETARWYGKQNLTFFDGTSTFADNLPLTPLKVENVAVSAGSTVQISNQGTEKAGLYIKLSVPAGVTVTNPQFERRNNSGLVEDRIIYQDTLTGGDVLTLDSRNHHTTENTMAYPSYTKVDELHGGWLQVPPGTHTIEVDGTFSGGTANLTLDCWDVYR
jgi:hypothetical protein